MLLMKEEPTILSSAMVQTRKRFLDYEMVYVAQGRNDKAKSIQ
jgi:hypothetical protein